MKVLFTDLRTQYLSIKSKIDKAITSVLTASTFIKGPHVQAFEERFAATVGIRHCIATSNGTSGLYIALKALGAGPGDEVLTPAHSWISSSETISQCGATPVFVDIDARTYTLDPSQLALRITKKTKGIIAVHMYGQMAHIEEIQAICRQHNLFLIEDCAQAHLTLDASGAAAGTFGDVGVFSFYPTKNLGAYGDAGCVVTASDTLAQTMRRLANHGALEKDDHLIEGINSRMDALQAAILLAKLPYLSQWNERRIANAAAYDTALRDLDNVVTPYVRPHTRHTYHIYAIRAKRRDDLKNYLAAKEIQTLVHYPSALPNLVAYRHLGHRPDDFPVASGLQAETLSLPIHAALSDEEISYVCKNVREFYLK